MVVAKGQAGGEVAKLDGPEGIVGRGLVQCFFLKLQSAIENLGVVGGGVTV